MFKTIRAKLLGSFILLTVLVIGMSIFSIVQINKSADGFKDYREMAIDAIVANDVQANMLMVRLNVLDYMARPADDKVKRFQNITTRPNRSSSKHKRNSNRPVPSWLIKSKKVWANITKGFRKSRHWSPSAIRLSLITSMPTARKWNSF